MKFTLLLTILVALALPNRAAATERATEFSAAAVTISARASKMNVGERLLYRALQRRLKKQLRRHQPTFLPAAPGDSCDLVVFRDGDSARVDVLWTTSSQVAYRPCGSRQSDVNYFYKRDLFQVVDADGKQWYRNSDGLSKSSTARPGKGPRGEERYRQGPSQQGANKARTALTLGAGAWASIMVGILIPPIAVVGPILALIAVIVGLLALSSGEAGRGSGRGNAIAGIVLGGAYLLIVVGGVLLLLSTL